MICKVGYQFPNSKVLCLYPFEDEFSGFHEIPASWDLPYCLLLLLLPQLIFAVAALGCKKFAAALEMIEREIYICTSFLCEEASLCPLSLSLYLSLPLSFSLSLLLIIGLRLLLLLLQQLDFHSF